MLNKAQIIGHLGADPELRKTNNGTAVCELRIATSERWTDKEGQRQEQTEWHRVILWNRTAENAAKYLNKGSKVYVEGKITTRKWQDKEGNDRWTTEIVVHALQFLDAKGSGGSNVGAVDEAAQSGGDDFADGDIPF